jgi:regulator of replication initiation timing
MQALLQNIEGIELKIRALADKILKLKKEKEILIEENLSLKKDLDHLKGVKKELELKLSEMILVPQKSKEGEEQKQKVKKELDFYLKEIDKCIDLMQNMS